MTKNEAIIDVLANFAYIDNEIAKEEVQKIKEIAKKMNVNDVNIDSVVERVVKDAIDEELNRYSHAIAILTESFSEKEKIDFLKKAADVITADGKIMNSEFIKLELLAKNWGLDLKKVL